MIYDFYCILSINQSATRVIAECASGNIFTHRGKQCVIYGSISTLHLIPDLYNFFAHNIIESTNCSVAPHVKYTGQKLLKLPNTGEYIGFFGLFLFILLPYLSILPIAQFINLSSDR